MCLCLSYIGSWSGVDGPSQMALEDIGMFRSIPNCVVFYPSDAVSCERAVELAANYKDMTFIRATRGNTPVVYENDEQFEIGKAKVRLERSSFVFWGGNCVEQCIEDSLCLWSFCSILKNNIEVQARPLHYFQKLKLKIVAFARQRHYQGKENKGVSPVQFLIC